MNGRTPRQGVPRRHPQNNTKEDKALSALYAAPLAFSASPGLVVRVGVGGVSTGAVSL